MREIKLREREREREREKVCVCERERQRDERERDERERLRERERKREMKRERERERDHGPGWIKIMAENQSGLEKSAAIRPFATKKSRLASEKILLADNLATEGCRLADRLATKLFSKRTTPMRAERDRARSLADVFVGPRCNGSWPFGPVDRKKVKVII